MNTLFRHGSLFSGIGGFDLAAEWMGWENVFHCEWNDFGKKVLKHYWPNSISYHDITKTDFSIHRGTIDILTGGFPCQPYSAAGKRLGKEDERHLWPEMLRAIREIQPRWIVGENVLGLVNWNRGMVFEEVQANLEAEGYEVQPYVLPAAAVNAPHRRDRVWFVAYATSNGYDAKPSTTNNRIGQDNIESGTQRERTIKGLGDERNASDSYSRRLERSIKVGWDSKYVIREDGIDAQTRDVTNTENKWRGKLRNEMQKARSQQSDELFRCEHTISNWDNFPTVSPICSRNDGLSDRLDGITFSKWRNESIKAGGNAIVPQVVFQIFKAIELFTIQNK
jgi:DNA (cytosine-5)-methyltransferase 1